MKKPNVSVIVPIYNGGNYLEAFLQTVISQTLTDIEIICIDDCSNDDTSKILSHYAGLDDRIRILTNGKRLGAAISRNEGIELAKSPYFICMDADDLADKNMLSELYVAADKYNADVTFCESDTFKNEYDYRYSEIPYPMNDDYCYSTFSVLDLKCNGLTNWAGVPWNKLIKKKFFLDNSLAYQNLESSNDVFASDMCVLLAERMIHTATRRPLLHHRLGINTQISNNRNPFCALQAYELEYHFLKDRELYDIYKNYLNYKIMVDVISELRRCKNKEKCREFRRFLSQGGLEKVGIENEDMLKLKSLKEYYYKMIQNAEEDDWYLSAAVILKSSIEIYEDKMPKLMSFLSDHYDKVAVFGAGIAGKAFLKYCFESGIDIGYVIDNDKKKQGSYIGNAMVISYPETVGKIEFIILVNNNFFSEIFCQINGENPRASIFSLDAYLRMNKEFSECFM